MEDVIATAVTALEVKAYTPKELADDKLNIDHICELTDLPEGVIVGLRSFASEWVKRQAMKCARF